MKNLGKLLTGFLLMTMTIHSQNSRDAIKALEQSTGAIITVNDNLDIAEFIIRGAMECRESRGAHYRSDHPFEDPFWNKTVILCKKNNSVQVSTLKLCQAFD